MGAVAILLMYGQLSSCVAGIINGVWHLIEAEGGVLDHIYEGFIGLLLGIFYGFVYAELAMILFLLAYFLFQNIKKRIVPP